jgi:superfamily II DNA or RNA helicase
MLKKKHGVLWAATNSGKTEVAISVIKALDESTLFLVKGKDLVLQTYERFKKRLGDTDVGIIMSNKWDVRKFTVASADTLARRFNPSKVTSKSVDNKKIVGELLTNVKIVIIDECHTLASDGLFSIVRYCTAPYRYGLSGTPFKRGDKQDLKLIALTGEVCYKVTNKEMIDDGVSVPTHITFVDIDKPYMPPGIDYQTAYEDGVVHNLYRNKIICDSAIKYCELGKQVLVIVKKIDHGHVLSNLITMSKAFIPHTFIHGSLDTSVRSQALEDFKGGITKVLIASSILDQGVDIPNIDVLIFASGGNSYIRAIQRVGRGLRLHEAKDKLTVVDFSDRTNKYLAKHSMERIKTYTKEKCFTISIVDTVEELVGVHH